MQRYAITEKGRQEMLARFFQKEIARRDAEALEEILKSARGRWFLMRLLDKTKVNSETFTGNSQTFYNEGMRKVGLMLLNEIAALGIEAVKLKQQAELEYIQEQMRAQEIALDYAKEDVSNE